MRQRELDGCLNPNKHHLWRLPSIPQDLWAEDYTGESREAIAFFPLFQTNHQDASLEHHLVRAGCWARRSWLKYSDAITHNIDIKFYVEDTVLDRIAPILQENGIDLDHHVILFDGNDFKGDPATHLGKKLSCFNNREFEEYNWILQFDCDMFLGSKPKAQCLAFEYIINHSMDGVGAVKANFAGRFEQATIMNVHWHHVLLHNVSMQEKAEEWLNRAETLVSPPKLLIPITGKVTAFSPRVTVAFTRFLRTTTCETTPKSVTGSHKPAESYRTMRPYFRYGQ